MRNLVSKQPSHFFFFWLWLSFSLSEFNPELWVSSGASGSTFKILATLRLFTSREFSTRKAWETCRVCKHKEYAIPLLLMYQSKDAKNISPVKITQSLWLCSAQETDGKRVSGGLRVTTHQCFLALEAASWTRTFWHCNILTLWRDWKGQWKDCGSCT